MRIRPFLTVSLRIPVRTAFGTVRIVTGFVVRLKLREWFYILAALGIIWLLLALVPLLVS